MCETVATVTFAVVVVHASFCPAFSARTTALIVLLFRTRRERLTAAAADDGEDGWG